MSEQDVLYKPFNIEVHKKTFINYLEVIIDENGTVLYAVPSHQEKLIKIACEKLNITRETLNDLCPQEYYADFMSWLCQITNCVALWNKFKIGVPNTKQKETIKQLLKEELYHGSL